MPHISRLRLRLSAHDAHYGGGLVDGARMATLMIERYSASDPAGFGPALDLFIDLARNSEVNGRPAIEDGRIRSAIARTYAMRSGLEAITSVTCPSSS